MQPVSAFALTGGGNVTLDGNFAYLDANNKAIEAPTMIRTGTGSIDIAAANDVALLDTTAPGVIYTAGAPVAGAPVGSNESIANGNSGFASPDIFVTPAVNSDGGGDIFIRAQNDITGIEDVMDATGAATGVVNANVSQFWWQWMEMGNPTGLVGQTKPTTQIIQTSIISARSTRA